MKRIIVLSSILLLLVPFTALAQDFCDGNFDYDKDVDGTDAAKFKSDFGRSGFSNPCPPDGPAPVPKTGQTTSYATGDDGDLERGVALPNPRFTDNGNGSVTDNLTGLIWLKDANCATFGAPENWANALADCSGLASGSCGLSDGSTAGQWRLPNRLEMLSLTDPGTFDPSLPSGYASYFTHVVISRYWTSTTEAKFPTYVFGVHLEKAVMDRADKTTNNYVWCVKGGRTTTIPQFGECHSSVDCGGSNCCCTPVGGPPPHPICLPESFCYSVDDPPGYCM